MAIEASDLTLVRGDLRAAGDAIRLSRRTLAVIKGNLFWAFAYNVAGDPAGRGRAAQPDDRRRGDGVLLGLRGHQQPAPAPLPLTRTAPAAGGCRHDRAELGRECRVRGAAGVAAAVGGRAARDGRQRRPDPGAGHRALVQPGRRHRAGTWSACRTCRRGWRSRRHRDGQRRDAVRRAGRRRSTRPAGRCTTSARCRTSRSAGACATGTHGSGDGNPCLAAAVTEYELVTAGGELVTMPHDDRRRVVALGGLGIVTALTLRTQPTYDIQQVVYDDLPMEALERPRRRVRRRLQREPVHPVPPAGVRPGVRQARVDPAAPWTRRTPGSAPSARRSSGIRCPVSRPGTPRCRTACPAPGTPGCRTSGWSSRRARARRSSRSSSSPASTARPPYARCTLSARGWRPVLLISEIRTIAADDLPASMAYQRDSVALHFTWVRDQAAVRGGGGRGRGRDRRGTSRGRTGARSSR